MKKNLWVFMVLLLPLQQACAGETDTARAYGSKGYVWGEMTPERIEVLRLSGDAVRGKEAYRGCRGCHKPDASGVLDGTYPRISGQHASVLIKQMIDTRAGVRINPKMLPFVEDPAITVQEIADIAVYLSDLPSLRESGKNADNLSALGQKLYEENKCANCHGKNGEGSGEKVYPVIANQHYGYLLRELKYIAAGTRGNSHPEMVKAIVNFSLQDMEAVADYLSRLPDYRTVAAQGAGKKK